MKFSFTDSACGFAFFLAKSSRPTLVAYSGFFTRYKKNNVFKFTGLIKNQAESHYHLLDDISVDSNDDTEPNKIIMQNAISTNNNPLKENYLFLKMEQLQNDFLK